MNTLKDEENRDGKDDKSNIQKIQGDKVDQRQKALTK